MNNICFFCESGAKFVCLCYKNTLVCDEHRYYCRDDSSYHEVASIFTNISYFQVYLDEWINELGFALKEIKIYYDEFLNKLSLVKSYIYQKVNHQHQLYFEIYHKPINPEHPKIKRPFDLTSKLTVNELNHKNLYSFINQDILYSLTQDNSIDLSEESIDYEYQILSQRYQNFNSKLNLFLESFNIEHDLKHAHIIELFNKLNEINTRRYYLRIDLKLLFKITISKPIIIYFKPDFDNLETLIHHKPFSKMLKQDLSLGLISQQFNSIYVLNSSSAPQINNFQVYESKVVRRVLKYIMKHSRIKEYENFFIKKKKEIEVFDIRNTLEFRYILISNC